MVTMTEDEWWSGVDLDLNLDLDLENEGQPRGRLADSTPTSTPNSVKDE